MSLAYRVDDAQFSTASVPRRISLSTGVSSHSVGAPRYDVIPLKPDTFSDYEAYNIPNWDGYDAEPIALETVRAARSFSRLLPREAPEPDIAPGADGTIGFEWYSVIARNWILVDVGPGDSITARVVKETGQSERLEPTQVGTGARALVARLFS